MLQRTAIFYRKTAIPGDPSLSGTRPTTFLPRKASVVTDRIFEPWDLQQQSRWRSVCIPAILRRKAPPSSGDDTITACAQVLAARLSASSTALISGSVSSDGSSTVINIIVDRDGSGRVKSLGG